MQRLWKLLIPNGIQLQIVATFLAVDVVCQKSLLLKSIFSCTVLHISTQSDFKISPKKLILSEKIGSNLHVFFWIFCQ